MLTYEEIIEKRHNKIPLTRAEITLMIVCQMTNGKLPKQRERFKRELIEMIMNNENATEEDRQILREEISRMSATSNNSDN